ncbi:MAG: OadG family protein [Lachnospiraceae bacterium]
MKRFRTIWIRDDDFVTAALTSWDNAKDELGAYVEVGDQTVTTDGNNVIINSDVTYENKTADVELIVNSKTNTSESMAFNINYTMAEKMEQAGLNTLMGLGIVFLMLIFLSFLISQFKHISKLTEKNKPTAPAALAPAPAPAVVEEEPEEELADDGERGCSYRGSHRRIRGKHQHRRFCCPLDQEIKNQ